MTTFTLTTAVNVDSLASKAGGDTYTINGGTLTIDQDSRYGLNQNTSASLGPIGLSATLGGAVEVDARYVRLIPYDSGSSTVPACNTSITQGSASGLLIGVYSALNVAPTAVGAGMPVTGWIKIKAWNGNAYAAGALGGLTATATGVDVVGWIELVGDEGQTITVNRLNTFRMRGEWYDLGTTDGNSATTYQIPTNGSNCYQPGVWVETAQSSGEFEFYPCAGTLTATVTSMARDEVRGKVCWISTAGLLWFQNDGTNSTGGYLPTANRKIRIPNIFTQSCTTAARTANVLPNATLATRYDFTTGGGGAISIDKACLCWYPSFSQPYSVALTNVAIATSLLVAEIASPIAWSQVGIGQEAANAQLALSMSLCFAGGTMDKCTWAAASLSATGRYVVLMSDVRGFAITNEHTRSLLGTRGNATTGAKTIARAANCTWTDCTVGCGRALWTTCSDCTETGLTYYDHSATTTRTDYPMYCWSVGTASARCKFDGLDFGGLTLVQPYSGVLSIEAAGCTDIKLRNIGTYASPIDMGGAVCAGVSWTRVTTTATVTKVAHGLKVGDIIYPLISSNAAAITLAAKAVLAVPTVDTFTFTCVSSGTSSGTLTYYPVMAGYLVVLATGAAANPVKVQRCYTPHLRTGLLSGDNSSKNILFDDVHGDFINPALFPMLNCTARSLAALPAMTAQTACYGTHWFDVAICGLTPSTSGQAWTRVTTTATVTSAGHNLRTGMLIDVTVSDNTAAIALGKKSITVLTPDTFSFTCVSSGSSSGVLTFVPLVDRVGLLMNEPTVDTATQYTVESGAPAFTSAGGLFMPTIGQQVLFTTSDWVLGYTGFPINEAVMAGGTIANYDITYSLDKNDGVGWGAFHNLYYPRAGGSGSGGAYTFTVTDATGVEIGDYVLGTNVAPHAKVTNVDTGTNTVTVDIVNIGTVSGVLCFYHLPSEANVSSTTGFKMRIRIKTSTTNTTAVTSLYAFALSTEESRAVQYPLDLVAVTFSPIAVGSEVRAFLAGTSTEAGGIESATSTSVTLSLPMSTALDVWVLSYNPPRTPVFLPNVSYAVAQTVNPQQRTDANYLNP